MSSVELPGVRLAFERLDPGGRDGDVGGRDPVPVVLVHGLGGNLAFWYLGVARPMARRRPVVVYDLRGHGRSELCPSGYTVEDMTDDLLALMDHLRLEHAHLVGHSFGGAVALNAAVQAPRRVASVTLVDVILRLFQAQTRLADYPNWQELRTTYAELGIRFDGDEEIDFRLLEALAGSGGRRAVRKRRESSIFLPFESWNGSRRAAERWRQLLGETTLIADVKRPLPFDREQVAALEPPVLAVYGELTYALPSLEGLRAVRPDLEHALVPGVGHFVPALAPDAVVGLVSGFLDRSDRRDATLRAAAGG